MEIKLKNHQNAIVAEIFGDIDGKTASLVHEKLLPLLISQNKIILNMAGVDYMSSAGLRVLLTLHRQASANDSNLVLVGLSEEVKDTMEITGFLNFFIISETLEIALTQFNGKAN